MNTLRLFRRNRRAVNLDLLRWSAGGHKPLAEQLQGVLNWKSLSDLAQGTRVMSDATAFAIESSLGLPIGWMDLPHTEVFNLSGEDLELLNLIQQQPTDRRKALLIILRPPRSLADHERNST